MLSTRILLRAPLYSFARRPPVLLGRAALPRHDLPSPARNFSSSAPRRIGLPQSPIPWKLGELRELGLGSYFTPVGWIQNLIEAAGAATGLPAWAIIPLLTIVTRVAVMPWIVQATQQSSKLLAISPELTKLRQNLTANDPTENQAMLARARELYASVGYKQGKAVLGPVSQAVLGIAFFFGVRKMCELPLEQFKLGGIAWFTDLTVADPTYILPALSVGGFLLMSQMSKKDMPRNPQFPHASNWIQLVIFGSIIFLARLPAGMTLQMATNAGLSLLQQMAFRVPSIRARLGIPPLIPQPPHPSMLDTLRSVLNRSATAAAAAKEKEMAAVKGPRRRTPGGWQ
ncbi:hypothetical protein AURDEDRAFT_104628 [Auricularia subglabra TFB-10046 SS5]|nr:hypothetical protein AURDEDRAFT_104628 [Auricularia subglabra TFB-10046 SS5]